MKKYFELLYHCSLFREFTEENLTVFLDFVSPQIVSYEKDSFILTPGQRLDSLGILLSGTLGIIKEDPSGSAILLTDILPGGMFGESFTFTNEPITVSVRAFEKSVIMLLNADMLTSPNCPFSSLFCTNLLRSFARKNMMLTGRIDHLTRRTLRDKVLAYLMDCATQYESPSFTIPFDRQQMADYLAADRSALSYVLSGLKKDGLISYRKNHFTLHNL